jgi:hypothetical protein
VRKADLVEEEKAVGVAEVRSRNESMTTPQSDKSQTRMFSFQRGLRSRRLPSRLSSKRSTNLESDNPSNPHNQNPNESELESDLELDPKIKTRSSTGLRAAIQEQQIELHIGFLYSCPLVTRFYNEKLSQIQVQAFTHANFIYAKMESEVFQDALNKTHCSIKYRECPSTIQAFNLLMCEHPWGIHFNGFFLVF